MRLASRLDLLRPPGLFDGSQALLVAVCRLATTIDTTSAARAIPALIAETTTSTAPPLLLHGRTLPALGSTANPQGFQATLGACNPAAQDG
jgi:hypothetical protein